MTDGPKKSGGPREDFYLGTLKTLIRDGVVATNMRVLAICGGPSDRDTLLKAGFTDCVIANLDSRLSAQQFEPLSWSYQDAESLTYSDEEFDFCIVHQGLHHCRSPHKAITEMLRVARRAILLIEPAENTFTSMSVRLGIGQTYEHAAVYGNDCRFGGVRNTCVPNYIYRLNPREIRKTALCFTPEVQLTFRFGFNLGMPWTQLRFRNNPARHLAVMAAAPALSLLHAVAPRFVANEISAVVIKPGPLQGLQPWLTQAGDGICVNGEWFAQRFGRGK